MNDTNPFIPQGSLLEQKNKKRARVKIAVLAIFAVNIVLISPLLLVQACHRGDQSAQNDSDNTNTTATEIGSTTPTNIQLTLPSNSVAQIPSNVVTQPLAQPNPPARPLVSDTTEYVVLPHDTYSSIAKKFPGITVKALQAANPDIPATKLMPGKSIKIPPSTGPMGLAVGVSDSDNIYIVKQGDYLINIAHKYNTTVKALQDLNDLKTTQIKTGQKLKVPVKAAQSTGMTPDSAPAATTTASNPMTPTSMIH